jgi:hypothetical protein
MGHTPQGPELDPSVHELHIMSTSGAHYVLFLHTGRFLSRAHTCQFYLVQTLAATGTGFTGTGTGTHNFTCGLPVPFTTRSLCSSSGA